MDLFVQFNRKNIDDRQIDTLIGISKGLVADGVVNQAEAEFLMSWLIQSRQASSNPIVMNLLQKVQQMLQDGVLDPDESSELLTIMQNISGESSEIGELGKPASLPLDIPQPDLIFKERSFLLTGTFAFGTRNDCRSVIESMGGRNASSVTKKLDYLILGSYVTDSWIHETFGRKIEKAMEYRGKGAPVAIISEKHWAFCANLIT